MSATKRDEGSRHRQTARTPLGRALRARRKALRLTQAELGQLLGVQSQTISQWELTPKKPQPRFYSQLVEFLDLTDASQLRELIRRGPTEGTAKQESMGELVQLVPKGTSAEVAPLEKQDQGSEATPAHPTDPESALHAAITMIKARSGELTATEADIVMTLLSYAGRKL